MVKALENNRKVNSITKSRDLGKSTTDIKLKIQKSKLEWANDVAKNPDLAQIRALL